MDENRYPRICLNKLIKIKDIQKYPKKYNYVSILNELFVALDFCNLWDNLDPAVWLEKAPLIVEKYAEHLKELDLFNYAKSNSCIFHVDRLPTDTLPLYLYIRLPLEISSVIAQIKLANIYRCCFYFKRNWHKLETDSICRMCNMQSNETIQHIFLECPTYKPYREFYLGSYFSNDYSDSNLLDLLNLKLKNKKSIYAVFNFITSCLRLRAEFANE